MNDLNEKNVEERVIVDEDNGIGKKIKGELIRKPLPIDLLKGGTLGFLVAILTAFLWYNFVIKTNYQIGIVAIAVGFAISKSVLFGTENKKGLSVQIIGVVAVMISIFISEVLTQRYFLIEAGYELPYLISPQVYLDTIVETVKEDPITIIFWVIAIIEPIKMCSNKAK